MGIYGRAIIIGLVIIGLAILVALLPEIRERLPRRRARREHHRVRATPGERAARPQPRPKPEEPEGPSA